MILRLCFDLKMANERMYMVYLTLAVEMETKMKAKRSNWFTLNLMKWYSKETVKKAQVKHRFKVAMETKNSLVQLAIQNTCTCTCTRK